MRKIYIILLFITFQTVAQTDDEKQLRAIYDAALVDGKAYNWLNHLSNQIGGRLSGSIQAQQAVDYTKRQMDSLGLVLPLISPITLNDSTSSNCLQFNLKKKFNSGFNFSVVLKKSAPLVLIAAAGIR